MPPSIPCPNCSQEIGLDELLTPGFSYWSITRAYLANCPRCGKGIEFQLRGHALTIGYTYSSGSPHFEGLADYPVPGLRKVPGTDPPDLQCGGTVYRAKSG